MADFPMNGRGFAPQAGSHQAYQGYQHPVHAQPMQPETHAPKTTIKAATALVGAGLSFALLIGVGVWSYKLISRDVAGVPVVRAVQGEMRIRPEDPGGAQALNQGLSVNDVAAAGGTAGPSERIVLAPEPIDLSAEETPLIDQLAAAQPRFATEGQQAPVQDLTVPLQDEQDAELSPQMASIEALAAQIAAGATPLTTQGQVSAPPVKATVSDVNMQAAPRVERAPATAQVALSPTAIAAEIPGVAISARPKVRPAGVRTAALNAPQSPSVSGARDVDPQSIPAGTRLVQLGAYESPEIARQEWERFSARFTDYMAGKDRVVQRATSGGRIFYRLRAHGFADLADARRFCAALTAQNTDCIPVVTR